jgi:peroxiredoxin
MKFLLSSLLIFFLFTTGYSQKTLPDIELKDLNAKIFSLKDYSKDKTLVFSFWATWCVPCINELDAVAEHYESKKKELNFELIAVSVDDAKTKARVKPMVSGKNWDYKILMDSNQEFKRAMNIYSVPYVVIVQNGKVVYTHSGYTPGSENELFKKLRSLL